MEPKKKISNKLNNYAKSVNLEQSENNQELPIHTKNHLGNNKEICTFQPRQKKMIYISQWKVRNRSIKEDILLDKKSGIQKL